MSSCTSRGTRSPAGLRARRTAWRWRSRPVGCERRWGRPGCVGGDRRSAVHTACCPPCWWVRRPAILRSFVGPLSSPIVYWGISRVVAWRPGWIERNHQTRRPPQIPRPNFRCPFVLPPCPPARRDAWVGVGVVVVSRKWHSRNWRLDAGLDVGGRPPDQRWIGHRLGAGVRVVHRCGRWGWHRSPRPYGWITCRPRSLTDMIWVLAQVDVRRKRMRYRRSQLSTTPEAMARSR
jgi:hypothetical protein